MLVEGNQREGERVRDRERETYLQSMLRCESRPQRMVGMPPEVWRGGMSTLRRVSGSNESRAAVRRAVVARLVAGETELRTAGREGEGLCSGRSRRRAARARAHARVHERSATILQSFKQPTAATQRRRGMVGSARSWT